MTLTPLEATSFSLARMVILVVLGSLLYANSVPADCGNKRLAESNLTAAAGRLALFHRVMEQARRWLLPLQRSAVLSSMVVGGVVDVRDHVTGDGCSSTRGTVHACLVLVSITSKMQSVQHTRIWCLFSRHTVVLFCLQRTCQSGA